VKGGAIAVDGQRGRVGRTTAAIELVALRGLGDLDTRGSTMTSAGPGPASDDDQI
jgi:hypothetical protein